LNEKGLHHFLAKMVQVLYIQKHCEPLSCADEFVNERHFVHVRKALKPNVSLADSAILIF